MQIPVQCPACKASFEVPSQLVGRDGECSRCRKIFKVIPLSGEVDPEAVADGDSGATMAMPVYDVTSASDTDEFDIPPQQAAEPDVPELDVPVLEIPELDLPPSPKAESKKSSAEIPGNPAASEPTALPVAVDDDGSLFGDELPELEDVREPISCYASEDEVDPDAGGSYSLSGSASSSESPPAKKPRRKQPKKKTAAKSKRASSASTRNDKDDLSDASVEADDIQLFDDVLHDEDDDSESSSSQVILRRSGTFSSSSKTQSPAAGKASASPARKPGKRYRRSKSGDASQEKLPVLKRLAGGTKESEAIAESASDSKKPTSNKTRRVSQNSPRQLAMLAGGGAALLLLAWMYSWMTSGPAVVNPTFQEDSAVTGSNAPTGPTPVPNRYSDSIQTSQTNSSVARANRIRSVPGAPRRVAGPDSGTGDENEGATSESPTLTSLSAGESTENTTLPTESTAASTPADEPANDGRLPDDGTLASLRPRDTSGKTASLKTGTNPEKTTSDAGTEGEIEQFPVQQVPIPKFPKLSVARPSTVAGIVYHEIALGRSDSAKPSDNRPVPGSQMDMILYLPGGTHEPASLPCVIIAAAGTTLLEGNGCFDESYQSETIPYVQQGFAVLGYSLDGPVSSDQPSNRESAVAYDEFRAAHAGLVNARNALEFVLQQVPAVNPEKIFSAGHSSAGTLSLLFAEHESRLAGCIAYAPCIDVEKRLAPYTSNPLVKQLLPGVDDFVQRQSPMQHLDSLKCPVFIFHAEGDSNAPISESRQFAANLEKRGTRCRLETIPSGDHYNSMLEEGVPRGVEWLKKQL